MTKRVFLLVLLLLLFVFQMQAQKFDLGDVTKEELAEKFHPIDTAAVAAILFKKAKTTFVLTDNDGFVCNTEFSVKIKIYKKQGLNWANYEIPFYVGFEELNDEMVSVSKAFTYNLVDGKIEKIKVTGESKYIEKVNELWKSKLIAFPNVKEGSIIELKYVIRSSYLTTLPEFKFQYDIPVNYMEYVTKIPEFYIYKPMISGDLDVQFKEKLEEATANFNQTVDLAKVSQTISFRQIATQYYMHDVPSFVRESFVNSDNYCGKIEHELQVVRMPNEQPKKIASDWESVTKSIYNEPKFGKELQKNDYFSIDINKIVDFTDSNEVKITKVFNHIKSIMNWDGKNGYLTRKGVEKAYRERTGNVAEINMMLTAMLRLAGLDANLVLTSTRDNGLVVFPNRTKFNYLLSAVVLDDKTIVLDATNKNGSLNVLPIRALNWYGRMIKGDGNSTEIYLMPDFHSTENVKLNVSIEPDGAVKGTIQKQLKDYNAQRYREQFNGMVKENQAEWIENKINAEVSNLEVVGLSQVGESVVESYSFISTNWVEVVGDKLFFSPLFFYALKENPFKSESRQFPVDFIYPSRDTYDIEITVPSGFKVESLPTSVKKVMKDNLVTLRYDIESKENKIVLSVIFSKNAAVISPDFYPDLKTVFNEIVQKENEKIILKKI